MKKFLAIIILVLFSICLNAQRPLPSAKEMIYENPLRAVSSSHAYEAMDTTDTKAPAGYEPFYISHIGRHGSRNRQKVEEIDPTLTKFRKYAEKWGGLTEDGQVLMDIIEGIKNATLEAPGQLTEVGRREHREIAQRMLRRFPEVFQSSTRRDIHVFSTSSQRVLDSRDSFLSQLPESLNIEKYVSHSERYNGISTSRRVKGRSMTKEEKAEYDSLKAAKYVKEPNPDAVSFERLVDKTFVNPGKYSANDAKWLFQGIISQVYFRQCLAGDLPWATDYFTPEEIYTFWWDGNYGWHRAFGYCEDTRGIRPIAVGCTILKYIIEDADAAILSGRTAADLRFSHDVYLMPFISLVGCTDNDYRGPSSELNAHQWVNFKTVMMAMNYQFIFYKNARNKILVKMLLNEREVTIPSVKTVTGPYYDWKALRKYLISQVNLDEKI